MPEAPLLIVDDDDLNVAILEEILGDRHALLVARDGAEAVAAAESGRPALVLMDVMMPRMNGYDACRAIKASPSAGGPQVVLVSAKASTAERVRGYDAGADDYLTKPFEEAELLAKVNVHLRLRSALTDLADARSLLAADNRALTGRVAEQTRQIGDARDLLVFALAKLAESRDPETGEHLERMREYCRIVADELSRPGGPYAGVVDAAFKADLWRGSPMHDIGKVGIPDAVLRKPGKLTPAEFEVMKGHAMIGATALAEVAGHGEAGRFLTMAVQIARSHHERFDGRGYPDRLVGTCIPLPARVVAVADVFDALTSERVYKPAYAPERARQMIEAERGRHFDPACVDALLARWPEVLAVRARHAEASPVRLAA